MSNYFGIPADIEAKIRARDTLCVYCHREMKAYAGVKGTPRDKATIEHLSFDGPFYWRDALDWNDVVVCCGSCNSSRGKKRLIDWFRSSYCIERGISASAVAQPVKGFLKRYPDK
jgi:hypothetical protein